MTDIQTGELENALQTIVENTRILLQADSAAILLADDGGKMRVVSSTGLADAIIQNARFTVMEGISGAVLRSGSCVYVPDTTRDARFVDLGGNQRSMIVAPLMVYGQLIGTMSVDSTKINAFTEKDIRSLEFAASYAAIAIENARLYQRERRRRQELDAIIAFSRLITQNLELEEVFVSAHQAIAKLMAAEAFYISLYNRDTDQLIAAYLVDKGVRYPIRDKPLGDGLTGYVIRTGKQFFSNDINAETNLPFRLVQYGDKGAVQSLMAVPLRIGQYTTGVLSTQSYSPNMYRKEDLQLLQGFADHLSIAVENAHLYSELQQRYVSLQKLNQYRQELMENISHELRTPLSFLKAYLDLLVDEELGELTEMQRKGIKIVQDKTNTLVRIVQDLHMLGSEDDQWLSPELFDLLEVVQNAVEVAEVTADKRGMHIEFDLPPAPVMLMADRNRLSQVLDNLLSNAIKYGKENTPVLLKVIAERDWVVLSVQNRGQAIPEEKRERIFERMYRMDPSSVHPGSGLGLAIVKRIVEAHHGRVWVESEKGQGSTFYVKLPVEAIAQPISMDSKDMP